MRIARASDSSIFIGFGDTIAPEHNARVISLFHRLSALSHPHIRNLHPAYSSLLIDFDPLSTSFTEMESLVSSLSNEHQSEASVASKLVEIPVCYDEEFAPDVEAVSAHTGLPPEDVIAAHLAATYFVYFLGFTPGFGYLGGLDPRLQVPRHSTPRKHVVGGSVGIAGMQTGVYPSDSPGGWQLIGRTPLRMFDALRAQPSLLQPGDQVRFRRIDRHEYETLSEEPRS